MKPWYVILVLVVMLLIKPMTLTAETLTANQMKIISNDLAANDQFGRSASLDGDTAAVGANWDDDDGNQSGSVYIFMRNQGGTGNWGQLKKLTASDAAAGDIFGYATSLDDDTVAVGAHGNDDDGSGSGSVYIFGRNQGGADNWGQVKKITASDADTGDLFGLRVNLIGDTLAVGAPGNLTIGDGLGAVYLYERNQGGTNNWGEVKKVTASDIAVDDYFGVDVALAADEDTLVVGALFDDDNGTDSGSAYIFERDQGGTDNWGEVKKITASDGVASDVLGNVVAISGSTVLVGAPTKAGVPASQTGTAYVYYKDQGGTDNWGEVEIINPHDASLNGFGFGWDVSISSDANEIIVGRIGGKSGETNSFPTTGAAYIFARNEGGTDNWGEISKLLACDGSAGDKFGVPIQISGDEAIIGTQYDSDNVTNGGGVYILDYTASDCSAGPCNTNIVLPETIVASDETVSHTAVSIENSGIYDISYNSSTQEGADVTFTATSSITLNPGFSVQTGAVFSAVIDSGACS